mmetsp:Transcript_7606/g.31671  ORF Transcript_7606/g.31671 Transcript_7606/m.31671 type:complete len:253 (-) Transcript_7606:2719-3477(-)
MSPGTETDPGSQTRPRSLRSKSTIIRFSARSFTRRSSASASATSAAHPNGACRRAVPLMGFASRTSCFVFRSTKKVAREPQEAFGGAAAHGDDVVRRVRAVSVRLPRLCRPVGTVGARRFDLVVDLVFVVEKNARAGKSLCVLQRLRRRRARRAAVVAVVVRRLAPAEAQVGGVGRRVRGAEHRVQRRGVRREPEVVPRSRLSLRPPLGVILATRKAAVRSNELVREAHLVRLAGVYLLLRLFDGAHVRVAV